MLPTDSGLEHIQRLLHSVPSDSRLFRDWCVGQRAPHYFPQTDIETPPAPSTVGAPHQRREQPLLRPRCDCKSYLGRGQFALLGNFGRGNRFRLPVFAPAGRLARESHELRTTSPREWNLPRGGILQPTRVEQQPWDRTTIRHHRTRGAFGIETQAAGLSTSRVQGA